jgi:hypothetical protein
MKSSKVIAKKIARIMFVELRKIHYNVMTRVMDINEADILAGRVKSVSARHTLYKNWIELQIDMPRLGKSWE